jgi:hypothetical protein
VRPDLAMTGAALLQDGRLLSSNQLLIKLLKAIAGHSRLLAHGLLQDT